MSAAKPLTARQRAAINALIDPTHETLADVAAAANVPESTLRRWRTENAAFKIALHSAVGELRDDVVRRLHVAAVDAVPVLHDGMAGAANQTQVRSAELVLKFTLGERLNVSQTSTGYVIEAPPPIADIEQWRQTYCPIFESPSPTSALPIDPNNVLAIDGNGHAAHNGHGELN